MTSGTIKIWKGAIGTIPDGFFLCDGNNGTPNLLNRMVIATGGFPIPGWFGGAVTHIHTETFEVEACIDHSEVQTGFGINVAAFEHEHGHEINIDPANHLPPYYALAFMMKS